MGKGILGPRFGTGLVPPARDSAFAQIEEASPLRGRDVGSLFRSKFPESGIKIRRVCPLPVAEQRLLGSYRSVLLLSRLEFIRLDSVSPPLPPPLVKKEADLSSSGFQTIPSYLSSV